MKEPTYAYKIKKAIVITDQIFVNTVLIDKVIMRQI